MLLMLWVVNLLRVEKCFYFPLGVSSSNTHVVLLDLKILR